MESYLTFFMNYPVKMIGIIGSRRRNDRSDYRAIKEALLDVYDDGDIIVSGGCPKGGDRFAEEIAKEFGLSILIHYPKWRVYGKKAGLKRNGLIARDADILIVCRAPDKTGGTEDTIKKYKELGKNTLIEV